MKDIIVIVGPTGVGKTKMSIELAKKLDGEIINADSVSIYKKLNIGSAKPTTKEQHEAVHHLIDIKNVTENYSVYDYQKEARSIIEDIISRNKRVIIVGGTGLYIKALLYDYRFTDGTKYNTYDNLNNEEILKKIKEKHPDIDIHVNNRKRLIRTLNKIDNEEEFTNYKDKLLYPVKIIGLTTTREILYDRINKRVELMINKGLLDEINSLKEYYKDSNILNNAIGYKEFYNYLFSNKSIDSVIDDIKRNSRRYAKRQYTFFNNQMNVKWFNVDFDNFSETEKNVVEYIN